MRDFQALARWARAEYELQPGFIDVDIEGKPASGLRYRFDSKASAERFRLLRSLLHSFESGNNELAAVGSDVVELWR